MRAALSIAGFDPCAGAGVLADIKTFFSLGVYGISVASSMTIQNTCGVYGVYPLSPLLIKEQLTCLLRDLSICGVKVGMLYGKEQVEAVVEVIRGFALEGVVVDPVFYSSSGVELLTREALEIMKKELLPLAEVVTPNLKEASILLDKEIRDISEMRIAAREIYNLGCKRVLIKGGHLLDNNATDIYFDGNYYREISMPRILNRDPHGTGCMYSSAIVAYWCKGEDWIDAIFRAKEFVHNAILRSFKPGQGAFILC